MPQAVIFDVAGTLIDSNDLHAAAWIGQARPRPVTHAGVVP
jgi:beta-phosphoglucomutase-like phosphatase (HAD superfamily)